MIEDPGFPARIASARCGSNEALGEIFSLYRHYLTELAGRSLAPDLRRKGGASDLVQETYLEAQVQFPNFAGDTAAQMRAWLSCLLLHRAAKVGRSFRGTHQRRIALELPLQVNQPVGSSAQSPSRQMMADEQTQGLQDAIDRLPPDHRQVMVLRYRAGLSFEEIGKRLGRSPDAARMLWVRAFDRLRGEMEHDAHPG